MIRCVVLSHIDPARRRDEAIPAGCTLDALVALVLPAAPRERVRLVIVGHDDDHVIDRALWGRVRPRDGVTVVVRVVVGSGALRSILTIAASIAAMAIAGPLLAPFGTLIQSIGTAAAVMGATLLVNVLIPLPKSDTKKDKDIFSISGFKNEMDADGFVPAVAGTVRWAPPYGATPWTEAIGDDRYITVLFNLGYSAQAISQDDFRIGDTPLSKYKDVEIEILDGYEIGDDMTIYRRQVVEEPQSIKLEFESDTEIDNWTTLFTKIDAVEISFDVSFAQGLYGMTTGEKPKKIRVGAQIDYGWRPADSTDDGDWVEKSVNLSGMSTQPIVRTLYEPLIPKDSTEVARGQYEVRWKRMTPNWDELDANVIGASITSRSDLTALRSFRPEAPVNFGKPCTLVALRIRGSKQLNGMLDNFNVLSRMVALDYEHTTGTWIERESQNPASVFRLFATGPMNPRPWNLGEDLTWLEDWHDYCRVKGLTCNMVARDEMSIDDRLADIAAAGRAVTQDFGAHRGVIIDRPRTIVSGHISPRNSWGLEWEQQFTRLPDAWRIKFLDETNDFQQAERIVPLPHFTAATPVLIQSLELPRGVTHPDLVWRHGRWRGYEALNRRRRYTVYQDPEHLTCMRGDMVRLSHFVLSRTQVAARVAEVMMIGTAAAVRLDEEVTMVEGTDYALRFRLADGTSVYHSVVTQAGTTSTLRLGGAGTLPEVDDLAFFGIAGEESVEAIILAIELQDDLSARLTLTNHAPEIETLTDAETPPPWSGRVGVELGASTVAPGAPIITSIQSGPAALDGAVMVALSPGLGATVPVLYEVDHRISGAGSWTTISVSAAAGGVTIDGYSPGDEIEIRARARGSNALWTAYTTAPVYTVIGIVMQQVTSASVTWTGTRWRYAWALSSLTEEMVSAAGVEIRFAEDAPGLGWGDLTPLHTGFLTASPWELGDPPHDGTDYLFAFRATSADGDPGTAVLVSPT